MPSEDEEKVECEFCDEEFESDEERLNHQKETHGAKACSYCGKKAKNMPHKCKYCGRKFCTSHRLPENHDCPGTKNSSNMKEYAERSKEKDNKKSLSDKILGKNKKSTEKGSIDKESRTTSSKEESRDKILNNQKTQDLLDESRRKIRKLLRKIFSKKAAPLYLIVSILFISSYKSNNLLFKEGSINEEILQGKLSSALSVLNKSLVLESRIEIAITTLTLLTIWLTYKYWIKDLKYFRRVTELLEKLVIVIMALIFLSRHIKTGSPLGSIADWVIFLMTLYVEVAGTWFSAKVIDSIDLSSDLKNWGLRLLGLSTIFLGTALFLTSTLTLTLAESHLVFNNVYWIGSICLVALGAFMEYRSIRRHPAIKVW